MANSTEILNEGQDYTLTVNHPTDTSGLTVTGKLFEKGGSGEWTLGTANGDNSDTDITIVGDFSSRDPGFYIMEIWADIGGADQELLYPDEGDTAYIQIRDRKEI